jgi:hypothetical protein
MSCKGMLREGGAVEQELVYRRRIHIDIDVSTERLLKFHHSTGERRHFLRISC